MTKKSLSLKQLPGRDDLFYPDLTTNISKVLPTALSLLGKKTPKNRNLISSLEKMNSWKQIVDSGIDNVVYIVLDALGLSHFNKYSKLLKNKFDTNGIEISSVFPTITSTCMASLKLGVMPYEHGIVGQKIFFPEIGNIIDTLTLRAKNSYVQLPSAGVRVKNWVWCDYPFSNYNDIEFTSLIENHIANNGLSNLINEEQDSIGYSSHVDCFTAAKRILETPTKKKRFLDIYVGSIDSIIHRYTTNSNALKDEIESIETIIFKILSRLDSKVAEKTAVFITADHGQENLAEDKKILISPDEEEELFELITHRGRSGRVLHLFSQEGKQEEVVNWISEKIGEKGVILTPKDYPDFIGKEANVELVSKRLGDVQAVLGENASLFFGRTTNYDPVYNLAYNATHGSLGKNELLVPLLVGFATDFMEQRKKKK